MTYYLSAILLGGTIGGILGVLCCRAKRDNYHLPEGYFSEGY